MNIYCHHKVYHLQRKLSCTLYLFLNNIFNLAKSICCFFYTFKYCLMLGRFIYRGIEKLRFNFWLKSSGGCLCLLLRYLCALFADLPKDGPHINGEEKSYQIADKLSLNCSSGKSHPPSLLSWFINDEQVSSLIIIYIVYMTPFWRAVDIIVQYARLYSREKSISHVQNDQNKKPLFYLGFIISLERNRVFCSVFWS